MKPVAVIDLFCGMGGFSQGAIDGGAIVIIAVDSWDAAIAVHKDNHPDIPVWKMELGEENQWRIFKRLVDKWRELGYHVHIHGSPPCQALSNASARDSNEGMPLVLWYLDLVEKCKPDSYSMENVVPVRKKLPKDTRSVVLNSADFGVAQTRRRCYAGEGWDARPSHSKDEWLGVIDVLPHIEGKQVRLEATGSNAKRSADTSLDLPSKTLCGSGNQVGPRLLNHEPEKPVKVRSLTMQETLTLQGFNPNYRLDTAKTQKSRWTLIGNAVPPPVAQAVIEGISQQVESTDTLNDLPLLGESSGLCAD